MSPKLLLLLLIAGLGYTGVGVHAWGSVAPVPSESECRPYIEKALKELSTETTQEAVDTAPSPGTPQTTDTSSEDGEQEGSIEGTENSVTTDSAEKEEGDKSKEGDDGESNESKEQKDQEPSEESDEQGENKEDSNQRDSGEVEEQTGSGEDKEQSEEEKEQSGEQSEETASKADDDSGEGEHAESTESAEHVEGGDESTESQEAVEGENKDESAEKEEEPSEDKDGSDEEKSSEDVASEQQDTESVEQAEQESSEEGAKSAEDSKEESEVTGEEEQGAEDNSKEERESDETEERTDDGESTTKDSQEDGSGEEETKEESDESTEKGEEASTEANTASAEESGETEDKSKDQSEEESDEAEEKSKDKSAEESDEAVEKESEASESQEKDDEKDTESIESEETKKDAESVEDEGKGDKSDESEENKSKEETEKSGENSGEEKSEEDSASNAEESEEERTPEEDLTIDVVIPEKLRPREHISQILKLDSESAETEMLLSKTMDITLRELKRLYDTAIQPLEILYKYRDLSNRHFGDPEIFSKPLILFMGPWSGGKSTIINYLLDNEYAKSALRTGAEPSPAYFNILMWGEREEVLDGTQLAADWTFSGLQKFGQGLLDRLRGLKLKTPLLEKVNIVEIPGILEIRKQVERLFPFNDACQWFIDRADIIFLVYDPSKLDVGPETEAILDQLKGREYQTRIILNKADQVKPEELMRVQGTLIWNISPLMSSSEPPVMYSTSLWSIPYEIGSPTRLLYAQEKAFLRDLRDAIDKRVENKIASARRFAVRVRNHAKMVDCYLTTYYNHKSFFGNRKKVADDIIEHPQNYHIYEGLSTLTNISRYDLPDPEVYRDFFRLNPVYDFQQLSSTCTYFRGCPINRLDVAIAYDLPELVGKYKKSAQSVLSSAEAPPKS